MLRCLHQFASLRILISSYLNPGDDGVASSFPSSLKESTLKRSQIVFDSRPESVHICVDDDEDEGDDEVEDQPDVDHLDVGRCRKTLVHLIKSKFINQL